MSGHLAVTRFLMSIEWFRSFLITYKNMENLQKTEKQKKGLLLKITLILTFLVELFWTIISVFFVSDKEILSIADGFEGIAFVSSFFVMLVVGIFSFYAIYTTSKMKRIGACYLLGVYIVNIIIFSFWSYLVIHYFQEADNPQEFLIILVPSVFICLLFAGIIWKNLKKMN